MQNIQRLPDSQLVTDTRALVADERRIGLRILHHLREIHRRKLHWQLGYSSLFTFAVEELKYSESAAWRRIKAMEALAELPELEPVIAAGRLSIATVSQVQGFCQAQKRENQVELGVPAKRELFLEVESKSKRETEKILAARLPQALPEERERALDSDRTEIRFVAGAELLGKLDRLKELLPHRLGTLNPSYAELLEYLADFALHRLAPERPRRPRSTRAAEPVQPGAGEQSKAGHSSGVAAGRPEEAKQPGESEPASGVVFRLSPEKAEVRHAVPSAPVRTSVSAPVVRRLRAESTHRCAFVHSGSGRRCTETRGLEVDHIIPVAQGGTNESANLQLLCRSHNLLRAVEIFGVGTMSRYVPSLRG